METANLQKGLVLVYGDKELIEEGLGFGVPVIKYQDKTYFSSSAQISIQQSDEETYLLRKSYLLDSVSKKLWRGSYIDDGFYSYCRKKFAKLYLSHKELAPLCNRMMEFREMAKIKTEFVRVPPRAEVTVNYLIQPATVNISVDFSNLALTGCEELLVINEQGSSTFDEYVDSGGLKLVGSRIGGWGNVTAKQAMLLSVKQHLSFSLRKTSEATLHRGWEKTKYRFSWAGLSYSLCPNHRTFTYAISIEC